MSSWGYESHNGPAKWHESFPIAKEGKRQSPIDLCSEAAVTDDSLRQTPFSWSYDPNCCLNVENTGSSFKVNVDGKNTSLKGGALPGEFQLWQFHAHWGSEDGKGSEHTVDGKTYAAELHLVHWNSSKYPSPNEAAAHPDGLAVLGLFMEPGKQHPEFEKVCRLIPKIPFKGDLLKLPEPIDPVKFLPSSSGGDKSYWTYDGSLTTPPLLESVIWTVFKAPMQVSAQQLATLRSMKCNCKEDKGADVPMVNNYRPPVPLGTRQLKQF